MKTLNKIILALCVALQMAGPAVGQTKKQARDVAKAAELKEQINRKNFTFQARYMYPMGGGQRYLNTDYDVRVTQDSLIVFLPYFGVAYSGAGYNSNEDNGIKFTSTKFEYKSLLKKNGIWYVVIKPLDGVTTNQLTFNIFANGSADLSVISINRERIRFDGYLKDKPKN